MSELPRGWAETTLGELGFWQGGGTPDKSNRAYWSSGTIPWVSPKDMKRFHISEAEDQITEAALAGSSANLIPQNSVLLVTRSGILKHTLPVALTGRDVAINQDIKALTPHRALDPLFIAQQIKSLGPFVVKNCTKAGTTVDSVDFERLKSVPAKIPPLTEQKRIVAKLHAVNAKSARARTELARIESLLARYKQAVLSKAFSGQLTSGIEQAANVAEIDPSPGVVPLWPIPANWLWCRTDDVGRVGLGRQRSPKNHNGPNMRPYLRSANVTWLGIDISDVKEMNFDAADFERFKLEVGDVLLNEGSGSANEVGKPAIWRGEIVDCCYQNTLLRVQPKHCSSEYLYYYFLFTARSGRLVENTQGVNIQHIGREGLARYPFPLASAAEQIEIVRRIESAFAKIDRLAVQAKRALELIGRLDEAILAKAFRGELVPQDESDEPANKLLERIVAERATMPKEKRNAFKRKSTMRTAEEFLKEKLQDWPHNGMSFQDLRSEFNGSYDDLKDAVFSSLSDENPSLQQVFDEKRMTMTLRRRGR